MPEPSENPTVAVTFIGGMFHHQRTIRPEICRCEQHPCEHTLQTPAGDEPPDAAFVPGDGAALLPPPAGPSKSRETPPLTYDERHALVCALFEPDHDCAHNMTPLFKAVEALLASRANKAGEALDPPRESIVLLLEDGTVATPHNKPHDFVGSTEATCRLKVQRGGVLILCARPHYHSVHHPNFGRTPTDV